MEVAQPPNYNAGPRNGMGGRRSRSRSNSRDRRPNRRKDHNDVPYRSNSSSSDSSGRGRSLRRRRRRRNESEGRATHRNGGARRNRDSSHIRVRRVGRDGRRVQSLPNRREAHLEYVAQHANAIFQQDDVGGNQRQSPPREIRGGRGQDRFPRHQENERRGLSPPQNGHREQDQVQNRNQEEESMEERLRRVEEMIRGIEQNIIDMAMGRQMMPQNHHHYHQEQIYQQHHHYHYYQQHQHQNRQPQVYWHNNHGGHQALHQHHDMEQHHHLGNWYGNPALQDHVHQGNDQQNQRYQHYHEHYHPHHPHQNRQPQINWHENHGGHQAHHQHHEVDHRQQDGNWDENRADHGEHQEPHPPQNRQQQIEWHENQGGYRDRQEPDIPMLPPPRIREENGVAVIEYLPQQNQAQQPPQHHQEHHRRNRGTAQAILLRRRVLQRHPHGAPPAPFIFREHMPIDESFLLWFNYHITNHLNEGIVRDAELYRAVLRVDDHFPRPDVETFWRDLDEFRLRMLGPERPQTPESPQYSEPGSPGYIGPGEENGGVEEEPPREIAREELRVQEDNERVVEDPEEQWRPYSPGSPQYGPPEDRVEEQEVNFNSQQVQYRLRFFMQRYDAQMLGEEIMSERAFEERWNNHRNQPNNINNNNNNNN